MTEASPSMYTTPVECAYCRGPLGDEWFEVNAWRGGSKAEYRSIDEANFCSQEHMVAELSKPVDEWWTPDAQPMSLLARLGIGVAAAVAFVALPVVWVVGLAEVLTRIW